METHTCIAPGRICFDCSDAVPDDHFQRRTRLALGLGLGLDTKLKCWTGQELTSPSVMIITRRGFVIGFVHT